MKKSYLCIFPIEMLNKTFKVTFDEKEKSLVLKSDDNTNKLTKIGILKISDNSHNFTTEFETAAILDDLISGKYNLYAEKIGEES